MCVPYQASEPGGERVAGAQPARAVRVEPCAHRRRQAEQDKRRRDVGDQRVLQQVDEQQSLGSDRLERRVERRGDQQQAESRTPRPPAAAAGRPARPRRTPPRRRPPSPRNTHSKLKLVALMRRRRARAASRGRSSRKTSVPSVTSCSTIITTPGELLVGVRRDAVRAAIRRIERVEREDEHVGEHLPAREHRDRERDAAADAEPAVRAGVDEQRPHEHAREHPAGVLEVVQRVDAASAAS